jgi:hypothetical protein
VVTFIAIGRLYKVSSACGPVMLLPGPYTLDVPPSQHERYQNVEDRSLCIDADRPRFAQVNA